MHARRANGKRDCGPPDIMSPVSIELFRNPFWTPLCGPLRVLHSNFEKACFLNKFFLQ